MIIIIILLIITILSLLLYYKINKQRLEEKIKQNYIDTNKKELENNLLIEIGKRREQANLEHKLHLAALEKEEGRLEAIIKTGEETIRQLEKRKEEQTKLINEAINDKKKIVDTEVEAYRRIETQKAVTAVESATKTKKAEIQASLWAYEDEVRLRKESMQAELLLIQSIINDAKNELDDYRKRQQAINEAILRQRELDEKQDFYRVKLTDDAKQDIKYLVSIIDNIKNSTLLYKLIWSEYIQKPFGTMLKNITGGKEIKCVIYKITNINTQEIYIGKTKADVTKRWTEHIKTSLNIGTVARSKIHDALFRHWDEFTFEILEEVDDESKLSQREKYYINFYRSNIYGYNMNSGG